MKPSKKQKGLENIYYLLEKEGVGDVVKLPKNYWKKEVEKFQLYFAIAVIKAFLKEHKNENNI